MTEMVDGGVSELSVLDVLGVVRRLGIVLIKKVWL